jgi:hypothetical protein
MILRATLKKLLAPLDARLLQALLVLVGMRLVELLFGGGRN